MYFLRSGKICWETSWLITVLIEEKTWCKQLLFYVFPFFLSRWQINRWRFVLYVLSLLLVNVANSLLKTRNSMSSSHYVNKILFYFVMSCYSYRSNHNEVHSEPVPMVRTRLHMQCLRNNRSCPAYPCSHLQFHGNMSFWSPKNSRVTE